MSYAYARAMLGLVGILGLAACSGPGSDRDKFVVFFTPGSTEIDTVAQSTLAAAAADARTKHSSLVEVEGYAAAHGNLSGDELLAVQRAQAVTEALTAAGLGGAQIRQSAHAPANSEDAAVAARRVTIDVDP